jgi:hypothetical protein
MEKGGSGVTKYTKSGSAGSAKSSQINLISLSRVLMTMGGVADEV